MDYAEMVAWFAELGEPAFRARQVFEWMYRSWVDDLRSMTNLPVVLRQSLAQRALLCSLEPVDSVTSADALTTKVLFRLRDGETIESVWMQYEGRQTVCVSSQVGCAVGCPFCATGQSGFRRNLTSGEMVEQILYFARKAHAQGEGITNVVFMGMGEPLANLDNVVRALRIITSPDGMQFSTRRVTVSTAGLVPELDRLGNAVTVNLAVSLNATTDEVRSRLMPINRKYPLRELLDACRRFPLPARRMITFEYVMINGINDTLEDARRLVRLISNIPSKVNLIPFNEHDGCSLRKSDQDTIDRFHSYLLGKHVTVITRTSRGDDISAACGQLRGKLDKRTD
jgi:23S rRNA (adenine2503-C2)-methyltransferase